MQQEQAPVSTSTSCRNSIQILKVKLSDIFPKEVDLSKISLERTNSLDSDDSYEAEEPLNKGRENKEDDVYYIQQMTATDLELQSMFDLTPLANLKQLWLNRNNIKSIEGLLTMQMPKLKKLSFSYNQLTCIRSLRRAFLPSIIQIQLDNNNFKDVDSIYQIKLNEEFKDKYSIYIDYENEQISILHRNKLVNAKIWPIRTKF